MVRTHADTASSNCTRTAASAPNLLHFRLPLRLHLLHELQLPSVIRHNNKTNKQQQSQKESFIKCGQDRPSQYTQGGLGPPCQPTCLDLPRLSSTVLLLYISSFGSQPTCLDLPRFAYCSISGASVVSPRPSTRLDLRSLSRSGLSVGSPPVVATCPCVVATATAT